MRHPAALERKIEARIDRIFRYWGIRRRNPLRLRYLKALILRLLRHLPQQLQLQMAVEAVAVLTARVLTVLLAAVPATLTGR